MSSNIWDSTEQKLVQVSGNVNINDSVISEDSTFSSQKIHDSLVDKVPFKFGITEDGQYGYIKDGADTVTPFKKGVIELTPIYSDTKRIYSGDKATYTWSPNISGTVCIVITWAYVSVNNPISEITSVKVGGVNVPYTFKRVNDQANASSGQIIYGQACSITAYANIKQGDTISFESTCVTNPNLSIYNIN